MCCMTQPAYEKVVSVHRDCRFIGTPGESMKPFLGGSLPAVALACQLSLCK